MGWTIAEFELQTDQEVRSLQGCAACLMLSKFFKLELNDCPPVPANFPYCAAPPANNTDTTCGPCNYASKTKCGTVERQNIWGNCTCNMAYCTDPDYAWTEIPDVSNLTFSAGDVPAFNVTLFRYYIPEGPAMCNTSILFRMATYLGDPDIYVGDPVNGASSISSSAYQDLWPWISYRSMGDSVHVCPTPSDVCVAKLHYSNRSARRTVAHSERLLRSSGSPVPGGSGSWPIQS